MNLKDITWERFIQEVMFNNYLPPMIQPEPFFTHTSVRALATSWLYRDKDPEYERV